MAKERDTHPRGLRDEANVGPDPRRARELRPLKELDDWKVGDGEPDIRGWHVFASTGRELGVVDELLVDTEAAEVVLLDVDLKRDDRHTLAPLRAAWIDHSTKRVVIDARELSAPDAADLLPSLPRQGALTDDDMTRFNDGYVRAYGDRRYDADRAYRLRRGDEELRFSAVPNADRAGRDSSPKRLLLDAPSGVDTPTPTVAGGAGSDESRAINATLGGVSGAAAGAANYDAQMQAAVTDDAVRRDAEARAAAAEERREAVRRDDPRDDVLDQVPSADAMSDAQAIDPRELDARVRIEEGGTVDAATPVGAVRYDDAGYERHNYGEIDERYGAERGEGRERVVSRRPWADDATPATDASDTAAAKERRVYYRAIDAVGD